MNKIIYKRGSVWKGCGSSIPVMNVVLGVYVEWWKVTIHDMGPKLGTRSQLSLFLVFLLLFLLALLLRQMIRFEICFLQLWNSLFMAYSLGTRFWKIMGTWWLKWQVSVWKWLKLGIHDPQMRRETLV